MGEDCPKENDKEFLLFVQIILCVLHWTSYYYKVKYMHMYNSHVFL